MKSLDTYRVRVALVAVSIMASAWCATAFAQGTRITARLVATVPQPVSIASAPGDHSRLFIVSRYGQINVLNLDSGQVLATPFLPEPMTGSPNRPSGNGMLGMVFHPQYATNGIFYLSIAASGSTRLVQGRVSIGSADVADPNLQTVFVSPGSSGQHTGGWIAFGLDGYLYMPLGDGHQSSTAQNPMSIRGKIIRIDVDGPDNIPGNADDDGFPAEVDRNYTIPADNPYADGVAALPEVWARGVRNPYRGSIDPATGDLWWGEVGDSWEEINRLPAGAAGRNMGHGWTQGPVCTSTPTNCATPGLMNALFAYQTHSSGQFGGQSIIGGVVYRGCAMPHLNGTFIFSDFYRTWIGGLKVVDGILVSATSRVAGINGAEVGADIGAYGTDARGEIYFCRVFGDEVYKIEPAADRDCNNNGVPDGCEGLPVCIADFTGDCAVTIEDLLGFLVAFEAGTIEADCDDELASGTADAAVTISDLLLFLMKFEAGC